MKRELTFSETKSLKGRIAAKNYCNVLLFAVKVCCDVLLCVTKLAVKACCETVWCNRSFKVSVGTKVSCRDLALKQGINRHNSMLIDSFLPVLSCESHGSPVECVPGFHAGGPGFHAPR